MYADYDLHLKLAQQLAAEGVIPVPHTLFQQLTVAVRALIPFSWLQALPARLRPDIASSQTYDAAAFVVYWLAFFATSVLVFRLFFAKISSSVNGTLRLVVSAIFTVALLVASPVNLLTLHSHRLYLGYIGIATYHNPTVILLKPLALGLFLAVEGSIRRENAGARDVLLVAALSALGTMAKPSFALCFLPAMTLWLVYRTATRRTGLAVSARCLAAALVPSVIILVIQYLTQYGTDGADKVIWAPFQAIRLYVHPYPYVAAFYLLSILFPLLYALLFRTPPERDSGLSLAWLSFLAGSVLLYAFAESGRRFSHLNFAWSAQVALFVLFVVTAAKLLESGSLRVAANRVKTIACCAALSLHTASGVIWLFANR